MHDFSFKNKQLLCEDVPVSEVADRVGTPFYLYSYKTLVDHFTKIREAFAPVDPLICFAMKANDNVAIMKALADQGAGFDIVSGGELRKAKMINADPQKIVFASVGKTEEEIVSAISYGILLFNIESTAELDFINTVAQGLGKKVQAALRLNPDVDAVTHQKITTGTLKNKFGIDLRSAKKILKNQKKYPFVQIKGLHIHIGSQIVQKAPFIKAISRIADFIKELRTESIDIEYFDIGGGMGIIYKDEKPQTAKQFADAVLPILKKMNVKIIMEPGRFIVGNAGIFVTRILYYKDNGVKKFYIVDGGMNDLVRPSLYNAYHEVLPVQKTTGKKIKVDVVGPICESGDFLAKDRMLPKLSQGSLLAVMSAGAYGYVMSSNYNVRPRVPEVMAKGSQFEIIKQRETFDDLIKGETIPDFLK